MTRTTSAAIALLVVAAATVILVSTRRGARDDESCGAGFVRKGARCCVAGSPEGECSGSVAGACPSPLVSTPAGCDAPNTRIPIPRTELTLGPSDWEAEGRVTPRVIRTSPFSLDAFEATVGKVRPGERDPARAAVGLSRSEAENYCTARGGRLPTEDEWIAAAAGAAAKRYPWGDTGAVCRRAAWGLAGGPCGEGGGADTVGAHPEGASPLGLFDLGGNVAEWVDAHELSRGVVKGGSWASSLAAELRTWATLEVDPGAHDPRVGVRCAYDAK